MAPERHRGVDPLMTPERRIAQYRWNVAYTVLGVLILVCCAVSAANSFTIKGKLSERDLQLNERLTAIENRIEILSKAKLGQDDFNERFTSKLEETLKRLRRLEK